jgi:pheromone a factor receptor
MNPFVPKSQGYSKAVDMWSVGVIAAALLTGDSIFVNRADPRFKIEPRLILSLAAQCDLSMLDDPYTVWRMVGRRPKDFVKKLLVLDEFNRMTATQALAHDWFTNKHYADELEAVYQRSIRCWNPRRKIFRLIEALDMSKLPRNIYEHEHYGSTSRHFPLATFYRCQSRRCKPDRKIIQASLTKLMRNLQQSFD